MDPNSPSPAVPSPARPAASDTVNVIPTSNRLLKFTALATWKMMKGLVKFAIRIPRWFVRMNNRPRDRTPE